MAKNKNSQNRLFLETSIIRKLLFSHPLQKKNINNYIQGAQCNSSFFVLMEYKRSVLCTLVELYYVAKEEKTPADVFSYYAQGFHHRKTKIVIDAIAELIKDQSISNDKDKFLLKLEMIIISAYQHFYDLIGKNLVPNKTNCPLAKIPLQESLEFDDRIAMFKNSMICKVDCSIDKFWKSQKNNVAKLIKDGELPKHVKNKGFTDARSVVASHENNLGALKATRNCQKVSDILIGLEMPNIFHMITCDNSFSSICEILNKEVTVLPSLQDLKRASQ